MGQLSGVLQSDSIFLYGITAQDGKQPNSNEIMTTDVVFRIIDYSCYQIWMKDGDHHCLLHLPA